MQARDAAETLDQVDRLRREAHRRSRGSPDQLWLPFMLFGALVLATPVVEAMWGGRSVGIYWAVAGPLGAILCGWYYRLRERRVGLEVPALPYVLVSAGIVVGSMILGWVGGVSGSSLAWMGPLLIVSAGYVIFAWLDRSSALALLAIALAAVVIALYVSPLDDQTASVTAALTFGGVLLATGLFFLVRGSRET